MFWQIIIQDDTDLIGDSVARLIDKLCSEVSYKFVRVLGFEGAADQELWARIEEAGLIDIHQFLAALKRVRQVDWATFCLSIDSVNVPKDSFNLEAPIAIDETIVRCVDGSLVYVYTKHEVLSQLLQKQYPCLSATLVDFGSVEWPE